jgi:PqqD family protein of HPr-rel-A system
VTQVRLAAAPGLVFHPEDDGCLVFDPRSGDTHLLDPVAEVSLRVLCIQPRTLGELAADVARQIELPVDAELSRYLEALMARLIELGLVQPHSAGADLPTEPSG